jgi:wyosine [tRNA(Phe)-imidazoG37] synthetase (radical SAM superfamily)
MAVMNLGQRNKYRALWEFSHGFACVQSIPAQLQIALSNTCNFKCVYCWPHRVGNTAPRSKLQPQVWSDLESVIPRAEWLAFHGISEFMMDPKFFDVVQLCAQSGATLFINTNGSVCTTKYLDVLTAYPGHLGMNFSIDAATPETFMRIRGWHFWRVLKNIKTYVERFEAQRGQGRTSLALSFVIMKSNVSEMVPFLFLAKALKMDSVVYYRLHEYGGLDWRIEAKNGGSFDYREECVGTFAEQYNREIEHTRNAAEILGLNISLPASVGVTEASPVDASNQIRAEEAELI